MAERSGVVTKIEQQPGKRPWKATVGNRIVNFWPKAFESDADSAVHEFLRGALESQEPVEITGEESPAVDENGNPRMMKDGKTPMMRFTAKDARLAPSQNGSQTPSDAPGSPKEHFRRGDPGKADDWLSMRWAISEAARLLPPEKVIVQGSNGGPALGSAVIQLAGELFHVSYVESLAQRERADHSQGEAQEETSVE